MRHAGKGISTISCSLKKAQVAAKCSLNSVYVAPYQGKGMVILRHGVSTANLHTRTGVNKIAIQYMSTYPTKCNVCRSDIIYIQELYVHIKERHSSSSRRGEARQIVVVTVVWLLTTAAATTTASFRCCCCCCSCVVASSSPSSSSSSPSLLL